MNSGVEFRVSGHVQGVAFRAFVQRTGSRLGLTGWVRNNPDGSVSGCAEGEPGLLVDFIKEVKIGNSASRVTALEHHAIPYSGNYESFKIRY